MEYHFAHAAGTADGRTRVCYIPAAPVSWAVQTLLQSKPDAPPDLVFDTPEMAELFAGFINRRVLWSAWVTPDERRTASSWVMMVQDAITAVLDLWHWFTQPIVLRATAVTLGIVVLSALLGWVIAAISYLIPSR